MRRLAFAPLVLVTAGCLVGPNYQRPQVEAPTAFLYQVENAQATADVAWWRQFQDPVLDALIAEAIANNKNLKIAAANVEQAAAVLTQTRSQLFPQVGYEASGGEAKLPRIPDSQTSWELVGGVSWEIDLWGRIRRLTEAARASVLASEEARRGVVLSLVASVANGYLQLRGLDEQLAIARRTLDTYGDSVRLFELQFKHGLKPQMTVEQARVQYETAAAAIPQLESQVVQTENLVSILLAATRDRSRAASRSSSSPCRRSRPGSPRSCSSGGRTSARPSRTWSRSTPSSARPRPATSPPSRSPASSAEERRAREPLQGSSREWSYGGSITGPLFTAGAISGQVRQVEAARQAALLGYEAAIQNAFADVDDALVARSKLVEQVQAQDRLVAASSEYARLARLQFDGGVTPYLTVLQAEQQLFPAELNLAQARAALFASIVNIYKAMGGGWVAQAETAPAATTAAPAATP